MLRHANIFYKQRYNAIFYTNIKAHIFIRIYMCVCADDHNEGGPKSNYITHAILLYKLG